MQFNKDGERKNKIWIEQMQGMKQLYCLGSGSVHVPAIQYFWFTIPRRRTENSEIDTLFCFPYLNTSNQQTVFDSNRSFGTFSHFCTVNNGLCLGKTPKCRKVTRKSKCNFFSDKSRRHSRSH